MNRSTTASNQEIWDQIRYLDPDSNTADSSLYGFQRTMAAIAGQQTAWQRLRSWVGKWFGRSQQA